MISELPNCLLTFILSLLSIKDAVKTSVLSRRWRHLFMLIPNLVVDSANIFSDQDHRRFTLSSYEAFEKERREFVMRVDQFMQLMRGRHIRSLTVGFFMDSEYSSHLDGWLKVAIASGLTKLELFLSLEQNFLTQFIVDEHRLYNFPYWLFSESNISMLSHLRLENCVLRTPGDFKGFRNLRTLELNDVILAEDFATEILPSCLLLEQLTFLWCKLKSTLCFDHPSLSLKHLKVLHCCPKTIIKISSMNLTTFEYDDMMKIAYLYAPQLKEICSINTRGPLSFAHFSRLPQLEILLLYVDYLQVSVI
ncbi:F-box/LRR-repeat protein At3g58900-like [Nicotiana tomentosiformis]|uniref:F-box/LRR-repeat protein At3g58900-like n=1 Tax=Nicotiana tomentosiformis TaxID=4098 RepID=UPI000878D119